MSAHAADPIVVFAAGSLRVPLTEIARAFEKEADAPVRLEFGPSGLLRDRILAKGEAHVFASANTEHPQALVDAGRARTAAAFTRNEMCALVRPEVRTTSTELLDTMLRPEVTLAMSTPKADPSGDYAVEVFRKAETVRAGSFDALMKKARQLVGAADSPAPPPGRTAYAWLLARREADLFLTYCTNATLAVREEPSLASVNLPPSLATGAAYGVTVLDGAPAAAGRFVEWLRGERGQAILRSHGFR